jgi:hypothetical protein
MKITQKQRNAIIKQAIKNVKVGQRFLCVILARIINDSFHIGYKPAPKNIQKYIPEFKNSTAVKYFNGKNQYTWWGTHVEDQKNRLKFLNYLLTRKLPK